MQVLSIISLCEYRCPTFEPTCFMPLMSREILKGRCLCILVSMHDFGDPKFPPFLSFSSPPSPFVCSLCSPLFHAYVAKSLSSNCSWCLLRKSRALVHELDPIKKRSSLVLVHVKSMTEIIGVNLTITRELSIEGYYLFQKPLNLSFHGLPLLQPFSNKFSLDNKEICKVKKTQD